MGASACVLDTAQVHAAKVVGHRGFGRCAGRRVANQAKFWVCAEEAVSSRPDRYQLIRRRLDEPARRVGTEKTRNEGGVFD